MNYSWENITLENYAAIDSLSRIIHAGDNLTQLLNKASMLSLASGKSEEYFQEMPLAEMESEYKDLCLFLDNEPSAKLITKFRHGGRTFTLSLIQEEIKTRQAHDLSVLKPTAQDMIGKMPMLLAAIADEKKRLFKKPLSFTAKVELFKTLPASIGIAICVFFWEVSKELQSSSITYLEKQLKELEKKAKNLLDQTSGG